MTPTTRLRVVEEAGEEEGGEGASGVEGGGERRAPYSGPVAMATTVSFSPPPTTTKETLTPQQGKGSRPGPKAKEEGK